jgi:hypothetical protein
MVLRWVFIAALMIVQPLPYGRGSLENEMPVREGTTQKVENQAAGLYEAAAQDINRIAGRAFEKLAVSDDLASERFKLARAAEMERAISERLVKLKTEVPTLIDQATTKAVLDAIKFGENELKEIGLDPSQARPGTAAAIGFGVIDEGAVNRIAEDTVARTTGQIESSLEKGALDHGRRALRTFRTLSESVANKGGAGEAAINKAIARGLITGDPRIADRALRDLFRDPKAPERETVRKLGNKLIEVGNATMSVRQYAVTVVRTRTREATVSARHDRLGVSGISLVQVVGRVSVNFCTAYLGLVVGLNGEETIDGVVYPALAGLPGGGPPFHPNCSKSTAAFVVELVSPARKKQHERASIEYRRRVAQGKLTEPAKKK